MSVISEEKELRVPTKRSKITLEFCHKVAEERGGKCLSFFYKNTNTKMLWQCSKSHNWEAIFNNIKNKKYWCPECGGSMPLTIEECNKVAVERGGKCLSETYKNNRTKMLWECEIGHNWEAKFNSIKASKHWCPECSPSFPLTLEECNKFAEEKGGKCLSETYKNNSTNMLWECEKGHKWEAKFNNIKDGKHWCPNCYGKLPLTLEYCHKVAEERGGKCLSETYKNNRTKMLWECEKGHKWEAKFNNIKDSKHWCPNCTKYRSEELCRSFMEEFYTDHKFQKCRPKWLEGLELDGYNSNLGIAFEYNGLQHYEYVNFFHRGDPENLEKQKERDRRKFKLCGENNVKLVIIPHQYSFKNEEELREFIFNNAF